MDRVLNTAGKNMAVFAVAYGTKKLGYVDRDVGVKGMQLLVNILVPMAIIMVVPTVELEATLLILPALSLCYALLSVPLFHRLQRILFAHLPRCDRGLMLTCSIGQAVALIGVPLVQGFYEGAGMARLVMYDLMNCLIAYAVTLVCALMYKPPAEDAEADRRQAAPPGEDAEVSTACSDGSAGLQGDSHDVLVREISGASSCSAASIVDIAAARMRELARKRAPATLAERAVESDTPCSQEGAEPPRPYARRGSFSGDEIRGALAHVPRCLFLRSALSQPPIIGFGVGIALKIAGLRVEDFPTAIQWAVSELAAGCGSLTFVTLGIFAEPAVMFQRAYLGRVAALLGMRYAMASLAAVAFTWLAAQLGDVLAGKVGSVCVLMPIPPVVLAHARQLGYDVNFAAAAVTFSSVLSSVISTCYALIAEAVVPGA